MASDNSDSSGNAGKSGKSGKSGDLPRINMRAYAFARLLLRLVFNGYLKTHVSGTEHLPPPGTATIMAANHSSDLDVFAGGYALNRSGYFLAKIEATRMPLMGPFLLSVGAIPAKRDQQDSAALRTIMNALEAGAIVGIAPEGTRSPDGRVGPYDPGFVWLAARTGAAIVPVAIHGTRALMPKGAKFIKRGHIWVRFGPPIVLAEADRRPSRERLAEIAAGVRAQTLAMLRDLAEESGIPSPAVTDPGGIEDV